jgi:hypothetical protein
MASRSDTTTAVNDPTDSVAAALSSASFVRLVASADGDGLAAAGLLARALRRADVPFQVRVDAGDATAPAGDDGLLVCVGSASANADVIVAPDAEPAGLRAYRIAVEISRDTGPAAPDPTLALAGIVADGANPASVAGDLVETAEAAGTVVRRPGVAIPVDDVVDGLTHSTLLHAPFSGDRDATAAVLSSLSLPDGATDADTDAEPRRSVASCVALAVAGDDDATPRAADAVERALRPYATPEAPFATLGGFADVLTATAREQPGTGIALALGHGGPDAALSAWRTHGRAVHTGLDSASTTRHDGVLVARIGDGTAGAPGRLATIARLTRDFRSPEPLVAAVGDGVAAIAARESGAADAAATLAAEFPAAAAGWTGGPTRAVAGFDADTPVSELVAAIRGPSA